LLARLPAKDKVNWRIGHFWRKIPTGYHETLESGEIEIKEPNLALYYEKLSYVISAPLWDSQRFIEIFKLNTGQYDYLIERYVETPNNEK
jgi:arabinofuranosyltransferase